MAKRQDSKARAHIRWIIELSGRFEKWVESSVVIGRSNLWLLCGFSFLYFGFTWVLAKRKVMWNDELYTYYISVLPSLSDVWAALLTGGEQLPPFYYVITRSSFGLFGVSALSIRLPAVFGFWLMTLCLFKFVSIRSSAPYGLLGALFPLVTSAYYYAYEARPYGLVLGFSALALLCWQSAARDRFRALSIGGMTCSLATVRDVSNNLKLYRADILRILEIEEPHFAANVETGLKPILAGYDIQEVPMSWINRTIEMGSSSFRILKVAPNYLVALFRTL